MSQSRPTDLSTLDYWYIACEKKDFARKGIVSRQLCGQHIVLIHSSGEYTSFPDSCPHRGYPLSEGVLVNGNLQCPYHGWQFGHDGTCKKIPGLLTQEGVRAKKIQRFETHDDGVYIWVRLQSKSALNHKPYIASHRTQSGMVHFFESHEIQGTLANIAENFLDPFHTHFVHAGLIRSQDDHLRQVNQVSQQHNPDGFETTYVQEKIQSGLTGLLARLLGFHRQNKATGRFRMPGIVELEYHGAHQLKMINTIVLSPYTSTHHRIYFQVSLQGHPLLLRPLWLIARLLIKRALNQDVRALKIQMNNIERFGGREAFAHSDVDIIRRHLDRLYNQVEARAELKATEFLI